MMSSLWEACLLCGRLIHPGSIKAPLLGPRPAAVIPPFVAQSPRPCCPALAAPHPGLSPPSLSPAGFLQPLLLLAWTKGCWGLAFSFASGLELRGGLRGPWGEEASLWHLCPLPWSLGKGGAWELSPEMPGTALVTIPPATAPSSTWGGAGAHTATLTEQVSSQAQEVCARGATMCVHLCSLCVYTCLCVVRVCVYFCVCSSVCMSVCGCVCVHLLCGCVCTHSPFLLSSRMCSCGLSGVQGGRCLSCPLAPVMALGGPARLAPAAPSVGSGQPGYCAGVHTGVALKGSSFPPEPSVYAGVSVRQGAGSGQGNTGQGEASGACHHSH